MANRQTSKGFALDLTFDGSEIDELLEQLKRIPDEEVREGLDQLRVDGVDHARELLDRLIYMTPMRGGYRRSRALTNNVAGFVRRERGGYAIYIFDRENYAWFNELGTYDYAVSPEEVINRARSRSNSQLVMVEYGREDGMSGLEPRPFLFPTMVWLEATLPEYLEQVLERKFRVLNNGGRG